MWSVGSVRINGDVENTFGGDSARLRAAHTAPQPARSIWSFGPSGPDLRVLKVTSSPSAGQTGAGTSGMLGAVGGGEQRRTGMRLR